MHELSFNTIVSVCMLTTCIGQDVDSIDDEEFNQFCF